MDYYKVLGLSQDCSDDDIKKAWRKVARTVHPDTASSAGAEHLYLAAQEAYETLSDPVKRASYDRKLKGHSSYASSAGSSAGSSYGNGQHYAYGNAGQGYGNGAPWEGKGYGNSYSSSAGQYESAGMGDSSYGYPSERVSSPAGKSSKGFFGRSKTPRGVVHRASWKVWAGALAILVPMLVLFDTVAGSLNAWGVVFLVTGALMLGLVVQGGTGYRDWKWWAWAVMGFWFTSTLGSSWLSVAYFAVPAVGAVLAMWQDGAAPVEGASSNKGKRVKASRKTSVKAAGVSR